MGGVIERIRRALGLSSPDQEVAVEIGPGGRTAVGSAGDYKLGPDDGVRVSPTPVTALTQAVVTYGGILSGSDCLYLHCGEGPGTWRNIRDVPMQKGQSGNWFAEIQVGEGGTFEFCFHDGADHWDNNNGADWSVTVLER